MQHVAQPMVCDCHVEVMDAARWQLAAVPGVAPPVPLRRVQRRLAGGRMAHVTLVQPQAYAGAHGCLLHALAQLGGRARGVAAVSPWDSPEEVARLHDHGVRGTRVVCPPDAPCGPQLLAHIAVLHRLLPRCWHIEVATSLGCLAALAPALARLDRVFVATPGVLSAPPPLGAEAQQLRWWLAMGNLYLKLVFAARIPPGASAAAALLDFALDAALDRVLWGSGRLAQARAGWRVPEPVARILDINAREFYGFPRTP
ncbi:MAG: hypothetical protein U1E71_07870 [Ramlibacter sp.]